MFGTCPWSVENHLFWEIHENNSSEEVHGQSDYDTFCTPSHHMLMHLAHKRGPKCEYRNHDFGGSVQDCSISITDALKIPCSLALSPPLCSCWEAQCCPQGAAADDIADHCHVTCRLLSQLDMSTARRRLKSPKSLYGTSTHPTMVTHRSQSWSWMIDSHPFHSMSISPPFLK